MAARHVQLLLGLVQNEPASIRDGKPGPVASGCRHTSRPQAGLRPRRARRTLSALLSGAAPAPPMLGPRLTRQMGVCHFIMSWPVAFVCSDAAQ